MSSMTNSPDDKPVYLEAIKARCEAASPGPWVSGAQPVNPFGMTADVRKEQPTGKEVCETIAWCKPIHVGETLGGFANAEFIAHARQDIPALLSLVAKLKEELLEERSSRMELKALWTLEGERAERAEQSLAEALEREAKKDKAIMSALDTYRQLDESFVGPFKSLEPKRKILLEALSAKRSSP